MEDDMTVYKNSFDGGSPGVAVSTANSGGTSGTAFNAATTGVAYSSSQAHSGGVSATFTTDAATTYLAWYPGASMNLAARAYYYLTEANSGGEFHLIGLYEANGNGVIMFRLSASNIVRLYKNIAPTSNTWAPSLTMPTGAWVRAELLVEQGTTTSNGRARAALFAGNSTTPIAESGWVTGLNLGAGTNTIAHVRFGKLGAGSNADGVFIDDLELRTGSDYAATFIGPTVTPSQSPLYRWNGAGYEQIDAYRWNGAAYIPLTTP